MMSLDRRSLLQLSAGAFAMSGGAQLSAAGKESELQSRQPIIIDALGGFSNPNLMFLEKPDPAAMRDMGVDARSIADALAAGVSAVNLTISVYPPGDEDAFEFSVKQIGKWNALIERKSNKLLKVLSVADIQHAHENNKLGVIFGFQNAEMVGDNASRVSIFADLGVRIIQLTYNKANQIGDGALAPENRGLTEFGREIVAALNEKNVLVDLAHSGEQTCLEATEASVAPITISHTGCRAVTDLPRNKTDQELRGVAESGGVVGIYYMPFLSIGRQSMGEDLVRHIEHALNVCGEDHVGLGSDNGTTAIDDMAAMRKAVAEDVAQRRARGVSAPGESADIVPFLPDMQGPEKFWKLAEMLEGRGHKNAVIEKILGKNFYRLMSDVWSSE